jgi:sulfur transfer complex TusBCD TusB component (DsrH family)
VRVLHLIRDPDERFGLEMARRQAATDAVVVVLLQEGVRLAAPPAVPTVALSEDVRARAEPAGWQLIDAPHLIRLLETHDRVFIW